MKWVWGDWLKGNQPMRDALKVDSRTAFLKWIEQHCVWFVFVQQLTTGAKHFVRAPGSQPIRIGGYGRAYGDAYGQGHLILDLGEEAGPDRWKPAASYLEVVVRFWRDFFRAYLPDPNLPASKHHVD